ncbi:hypothetical protein VNI00_000153 [Paramarasmius palmivorus]|uniref:Glucose-methanol-choline oxidoreductase N-terminal domain-containing protein n=1 Tax=Paramarasmius palmivorus TaxID=297713 RepID=A0AAW0EER1_9AGAR
MDTIDSADYLIVGGVVIIEAGEDVSAIPEVRIPGQSCIFQYAEKTALHSNLGLFVENLKNPQLNWAFTSTPQKHADGRIIPLPRGKSLGGSTNLNFMQLNRPSANEFNDAFAALGIEGWSYEDLLPYFQKFEKVTKNPETFSAAHMEPEPSIHGGSGPLEVTAPADTTETRELFFKAMNEFGVKTIPDCANRNNVGTWNSFQAIEPTGCTRASADTAYLKPALAKLPNLQVLSGAYVTRLVLRSSDESEEVVATGVEYTKGDKTYLVKANKEVIVCAGAYQTPQILELSGIGNRYPFQVRYRNLGTCSRCGGQSTQTERKGKFSIVPLSFAVLPADKVMTSEEVVKYKDLLRQTAAKGGDPIVSKMVDLQLGWIDKGLAFLEVMESPSFYPTSVQAMPEAGKDTSPSTWHYNILCRVERPAIDPNFLSEDVDMENLLAACRFVRNFVGTKVLSEAIVKEVAPAIDIDNAEGLREYIKTNFFVVYPSCWNGGDATKGVGRSCRRQTQSLWN